MVIEFSVYCLYRPGVRILFVHGINCLLCQKLFYPVYCVKKLLYSKVSARKDGIFKSIKDIIVKSMKCSLLNIFVIHTHNLKYYETKTVSQWSRELNHIV